MKVVISWSIWNYYSTISEKRTINNNVDDSHYNNIKVQLRLQNGD